MATPTIQEKKYPTLVLVGRVNVGKSTLFNRLIEEQKALVSSIPGTTRTSNEGLILWQGRVIRIIDTGGLTFDDAVLFEADIIKQSEKALKEADLVVMVTDVKNGLLPQEIELARRLKKKKTPILLVANKVDTTLLANRIHDPEWKKLGFGEPFPVSAANGRNLGDFLDHIYEKLSETHALPPLTEDEGIIKLSIIGKPNVGKSSLFNKLIGEEKAIVSDIPHTTRESLDTLVIYPTNVGNEMKEQKLLFIDTAGIRRRAQVSGELERGGIQKSITSLEAADMILLVIDGSEPISSQDKQLGALIERKAKSVIILINKWDLADDNSDHKRNEVKKMVYAHFPHLDFAPIFFVSGKTGYRVHQLFPEILHIWQARHTEIGVKALEYFIKQATKEHRPARGKGTRHPEIMGIRQIGIAPPVFELFIKHRTSLHRSYLSYLENRLREQFDFLGTPIIMKLTKMKR